MFVSSVLLKVRFIELQYLSLSMRFDRLCAIIMEKENQREKVWTS